MTTTKKFLQAAAGVGGGEELLAIEDVFSTYLYTGNGSIQAIENGISLSQSNSGGSVLFDGTFDYVQADAALDFHTSATASITFEMFLYIADGFTGVRCPFAINRTDGGSNFFNFEVDPPSGGTGTFGFFSNNPSTDVTFGSYTDNTWYHIAITYDGTNIKVYQDGSLIQTIPFTSTVSGGFSTAALNIGMETDSGPTAGNFYEGFISNFRISNNVRYTSNFTAPTSALTSDGNTELLCFQGTDPLVDNSSNSISLSIGGEPQEKSFGPFTSSVETDGGLVWIKNRDASQNHMLFDTKRGNNDYLYSNATNGSTNSSGINWSFNSDGFSQDNNYALTNASGVDYASWTFRKAPRFFDVVTYTGDSTDNRSISHNLEIEPGCIIIKNLDDTAEWYVYHRSLGTDPSGDTYYLVLDKTDAKSSSDTSRNVTASSTDFTVDLNFRLNASGANYVAYLFAHDPLGPSGDGSDGLIACGSYTGNGSTDGPEIDLGWEPQWVMVKRASGGTGGWFIFDNMRGIATGGADATLQAESANAENTSDNRIHLTASGFKVETTSSFFNNSPDTYIYIAIRRGPMRVPESGTEVFDVQSYNGGTGLLDTGFVTDLFLPARTENLSYSDWYAYDRIRGENRWLAFDETLEERTDSTWQNFDLNNGIYWSNAQDRGNVNGAPYISYFFKRAPNFFDIVAYTGNGVVGRQIPHNLGATPEMMIIKRRDSAREWVVYHSATGNTGKLVLNNNEAVGTDSWFDSTDPTDTYFVVGSNVQVNTTSGTYIAYLFASVDGVSKVGSYTGNGASQTINCGFTSGARFVLIRRTDSTGNWIVYDTAQGIVSGSETFRYINGGTALQLAEDSIDPASVGFTVNQGGVSDNNINGASYIFYAIS